MWEDFRMKCGCQCFCIELCDVPDKDLIYVVWDDHIAFYSIVKLVCLFSVYESKKCISSFNTVSDRLKQLLLRKLRSWLKAENILTSRIGDLFVTFYENIWHYLFTREMILAHLSDICFSLHLFLSLSILFHIFKIYATFIELFWFIFSMVCFV